MSDRQWHTFTVRFGTDGPLDVSGLPSEDPYPTAHIVAAEEALVRILGTDQALYVDEVYLFPEGDGASVNVSDIQDIGPGEPGERWGFVPPS